VDAGPGGGDRARYVLSFGCGVNTVALMVHLIEQQMPFDEALFADTGGELPETYAYLSTARSYLDRHGKPLITVKSKTGTLYGTCQRREVFPSQVWRWSTRDYKITPIHAYYRSLKTHIYEYMGIAYDEITRMKSSSKSFITTLYPLVDSRLTRADCVAIIKGAGLPVPPKSGCYFCPFNNEERWRQLLHVHPELYRKAQRLEEKSKHFPSQSLVDLGLRTRLGVSGLRELRARFGEESASSSPDGTDAPCSGYCMT
jgi:hypothetical protein